MKAILFTGFPGFIGMRLLPRILELSPGARVACLVQPKFAETARVSAAALEAAHPHVRGCIELVAGDITQPGLGLEPSRARELRHELWQCYHLAAAYDLAVSSAVGTRVNVDGTRRVLELCASAPGFDRLQYVSTAYVSGRVRGVFRETDLDVGQGFKNHYERTKFLAELEVARSGVPATIYRPGVVVGDSKTGETAKFDGPYLVLRLMDRLPSPGVFFRVGSGEGGINIVPIDFVIEAIARLAALPHGRGRTYHLCDPHPKTSAELARMFARATGRRFVFVPVPVRLARACFVPGAVQRYFAIPPQAIDYFDDRARHDTTQAARDLSGVGLSCPKLEGYLERLVGFYREHRDGVRVSAMV